MASPQVQQIKLPHSCEW